MLLEPAVEKAAGQKHSLQKKRRWYKTCTAIKRTQLMRFAKHSISHGLPCIGISKLKEVNLAGFEKNICYVL
jgi:hypothetical protein